MGLQAYDESICYQGIGDSTYAAATRKRLERIAPKFEAIVIGLVLKTSDTLAPPPFYFYSLRYMIFPGTFCYQLFNLRVSRIIYDIRLNK